MFKKLTRRIKHERPSYVLLSMIGWIVEQILGRTYGALLGWKRSYLGRGSRVIGTRYISVGQSAHINRYAWIEAVHTFRNQQFQPILTIGKRFAASDRLHISCVNKVEIGDDCLFGSGVYISDHNHGSYNGLTQSLPSEPPCDRKLSANNIVAIGSNVWMGDNVVIVGQISIGDGAVIGANSVVTRDVPSNVVAAGSPVKVIKIFDPQSKKWERAR